MSIKNPSHPLVDISELVHANHSTSFDANSSTLDLELDLNTTLTAIANDIIKLFAKRKYELRTHDNDPTSTTLSFRKMKEGMLSVVITQFSNRIRLTAQFDKL